MSKPPSSTENLQGIAKPVESHLSWIEDPDILKQIPGHQGDLSNYIEDLLDTSRHFYLKDDMEELINCDDDGDNIYATFRDIAGQLSLSAMWAYIKNYEESQKRLHTAEILVKGFLDIREGHKAALDYCIEALKLTMQTKTEKVLSEEKVEKLQEKWEDLTMKNEKDSQAVLQYFKARLSQFLMVPLETVLEKMENVMKIEPDYYEWYQAVYHIRRRIRRNVKRTRETVLQSPCEKEQDACRIAYELAPNNFQCLFDVALLIQEGLWTLEAAEWDKEEEDYLLCLNVLRAVIKITEEKRLTRYIFKAKVKFAEFVLFGRGSKLEQFQNEGKTILEQCETTFRNTNYYSFVIRKLAKLYHYGANGTGKFKDTKLAKTYYRKSLREGQYNFACLMDYLKLVKSEASKLPSFVDCQKLYQEILEEIMKCRELTKLHHHLATLCILEGCILWIYNPCDKTENVRNVKACVVWLQVFSNWPDFAESLFRAIEKPQVYLAWNKPCYVSIPMLIDTLKSMKRSKQTEAPGKNLDIHISTFIDGLRVIQQKNQNQSGWRNRN